ncbi:hypothetical protein F444_06148 [Phytophthora nicotianae P1976]|nr:hypothetical protein F444_06148 [Phytophthora nicotianae P1976]
MHRVGIEIRIDIVRNDDHIGGDDNGSRHYSYKRDDNTEHSETGRSGSLHVPETEARLDER